MVIIIHATVAALGIAVGVRPPLWSTMKKLNDERMDWEVFVHSFMVSRGWILKTMVIPSFSYSPTSMFIFVVLSEISWPIGWIASDPFTFYLVPSTGQNFSFVQCFFFIITNDMHNLKASYVKMLVVNTQKWTKIMERMHRNSSIKDIHGLCCKDVFWRQQANQLDPGLSCLVLALCASRGAT